MARRSVVVERTRERLIRAARDQFTDRRYADVTLVEIADAAGVTVQTLLNHFGSKEGMLTAAAEVLGTDVDELRGHVEPGDIDGAIAALMRQYEHLGDVNWWFVADSERVPSMVPLLDGARAHQRSWLRETFEPFVPTEEAVRDEVLAALFAAADVGTWKLLRRDLGYTPEATAAVLRRLIVGAWAQGAP